MIIEIVLNYAHNHLHFYAEIWFGGEYNMDGNVIVGQSGGPTSVINSSLAGVYKTAIDRGAKKVYGMLHGIKGLLDGQYVDLSEKIN